MVDELGVTDGIQVDSDRLQSQIRNGQKRLADLKPRKARAFKQYRLETGLGHERRKHGAGGPAAYDGQVNSLFTLHELRR
jgi:hypothetical protein